MLANISELYTIEGLSVQNTLCSYILDEELEFQLTTNHFSDSSIILIPNKLCEGTGLAETPDLLLGKDSKRIDVIGESD